MINLINLAVLKKNYIAELIKFISSLISLSLSLSLSSMLSFLIIKDSNICFLFADEVLSYALIKP